MSHKPNAHTPYTMIPNEILDNGDIPASHKIVWCAIKRNTNGFSWESKTTGVKLLAIRTGYSERQIQRILRSMEKYGMIKIKFRNRLYSKFTLLIPDDKDLLPKGDTHVAISRHQCHHNKEQEQDTEKSNVLDSRNVEIGKKEEEENWENFQRWSQNENLPLQ